MDDSQPTGKDPKKEKLHLAMDRALLALGKLHATLESSAKGTDEVSDERAAYLARLLWINISNSTIESSIGEVSLPLHIVATLLEGIKDLETREVVLKQAEDNLDNMWHLFDKVSEAFYDPHETRRAYYTQNALSVLGLTTRKSISYLLVRYEFERLISGPNKISKTKAYELLARKNNKSVDGIRKGIQRQIQRSQSARPDT